MSPRRTMGAVIQLSGPRSELAALPPQVRRVFLGVALSALGSGLTVPFLYVYLSQMRGVPTVGVGLLLAAMGAVAAGVVPVVGMLIDAVGPRVVAIAGQAAMLAAVLILAGADSLPRIVLALALFSSGNSATHPAMTALLARLVEPARRQRAFGWQFMLINAALGTGGLIGGSMISLAELGSFQRLYALDAASFAANALVLASLPRGTGLLGAGAAESSGSSAAGGSAAAGGWRRVLADRAMRRYVVLSTLLLTFGYSQIETGFSAYAVDVAGVEPRVLGWAFGANTATIVLAQLTSLRYVDGRRRSAMLSLTGAIWALSWAVVAVSALVPGPAAAICIVGGLALFGLGETVLAPTAPALVNELAVEDLRGRYNALAGLTWTVSMMAGPAVGALLIGTGHAGVWVAATVGGAGVSSILFRRLRAHVTDAQDGVARVAVPVAH